MHVSRIELSGFKSFARPTTLTFDKGVTCVVGPNGSGKSNVADAIRWVVGEQSTKSLRSTSSEDLIFAGSDAKRRSALAEVSITFDNQDGSAPITYKEFTITRRVDRSGTSTYLLNKSKTRLIDIKELLAKAGFAGSTYSIISQGTVDKLITATAKERRDILEDAAGIRPYKLRRAQAITKLAASKRNLEQTSLQLEELTPLVRSLERQAKRAAKKEALLQERASLVRHVFGHQYASVMATAHHARHACAQVRQEIHAQSRRVASLEQKITQQRTELQAVRAKQADLRTTIDTHEAEKRDLLEQQSLVKGRLQAALEADARDDIQRLEQRIETLKATLRTRNNELRTLHENHEQAEQAYRAAKQEEQSMQDALTSLRTEQQALESKRSQLEQALTNAYDPSRDAADVTRLDELLNDHKATYTKLCHDIDTTTADAKQHRHSEKAHEQTLADIDATMQSLQAKIDALELPEEAGLSVNDIRDTLARVVSQERAVIEASRRCHTERELRSIFTHIERTHEELTRLYEFLQQQTGDESSKTVQDLLEARDQLATAQAQRMNAQEALQRAHTDSAVTQERLQSYLSTKERLERDIARATAEREEAQRRIDQHNTATDQHDARAQLNHITQQRQALEQAVQKAQNKHRDAHTRLNETQRTCIEAEARRSAHEEQFDALVQELQEAHTQRAAALQANAEEAADTTKIRALKTTLLALQKAVSEKEAAIQNLHTQQDTYAESVSSCRSTLARLQAHHKEAHDHTAQQQQSIHQHEITLARVDEQLRALTNDMVEHCGVQETMSYQTTFVHAPFTLSEEDSAQQTKRFAAVERELATIGDIPSTISKEYQETNERFVFLSTQHDDAVRACETLESSITSLDRRISTQFNEMFQKIQIGFARTFTQLFNGGSGTIQKERVRIDSPEHTDTKPLYEDHIEITVTPPGKSLTSISALSGGEKALASIALLLAIIEHNPSPFIVLDEVDAALDEANAEHFARVIKHASTHSQFIVVTHARATMQQAHTLYGITMQEPGVSTALSLHLDHATKLVDQKKVERSRVAA